MIAFAYGLVCYAAFFVTILYAIGFVANLGVPKSIDSGAAGPVGQAIVINVLLLSLFVVQHTIMARPAFKRWWTQYVPKPVERSTFVLLASLILLLAFWQWRPIAGGLWRIEDPLARGMLYGISFMGWALVFYASFLIDHFDLFGLRQVYFHLRRQEYTHPEFQTPLLYRLVRNPLMLGFLIAFWFTPDMTYGHLLFAGLTTGYIFFGVSFEERDLAKVLGEDYLRYRERTPMILPLPRKKPVEDRVAPPVAGRS